MRKAIVSVDQKLNDDILTIQVEMDGLKQLIAYMLSTTEYLIPQEKIDALQADFMKKNKIYNDLKSEIEALIPDGFIKEKTSWNLMFATAEVEFVEE